MSLSALVLLAIACGSPLTSARPSVVEHKSNHESSMSQTMMSSGNGYEVMLSQVDVDGKCTSKVTIMGHGIRKVIDYPCGSTPSLVINLNQTLLVGDQYFTDTPGQLVHFTGDKCEREVFKGTEGALTSHVEPMDDKSCKEVKNKAEVLKQEQEKWNQWYKEQQQKINEQLQGLQQNLWNAEKQLFGGLGGMFG